MSEQALGTRDGVPPAARRSLIPFVTGDQVIEAIGPMCMRTHDLVRIIEHGADHCVTSTGHVYTRRGTSIPRDDEPYRSITSPDYAQDWQPPDLTTSPKSASESQP